MANRRYAVRSVQELTRSGRGGTARPHHELDLLLRPPARPHESRSGAPDGMGMDLVLLGVDVPDDGGGGGKAEVQAAVRALVGAVGALRGEEESEGKRGGEEVGC